MLDKIALLVDETGCDPSEAELALAMCGFEVSKAVRLLEQMLHNILVLSAKFADFSRTFYGLFLAAFDVKASSLKRLRLVASFNPAAYTADLESDWFDFEKQIYGLRLREGSLIDESLSLEQALAARLRNIPPGTIKQWVNQSDEKISSVLEEDLKAAARSSHIQLKVKKLLINLGHYRSLKIPASRAQVPSPQDPESGDENAARPSDPLVLGVSLLEDPAGVSSKNLRSADTVWASITDSRDIAQYVARLLGNVRNQGTSPLEVPVEAVEAVPEGVLIRVRFSSGICGDVLMHPDTRLAARRPSSAGIG